MGVFLGSGIIEDLYRVDFSRLMGLGIFLRKAFWSFMRRFGRLSLGLVGRFVLFGECEGELFFFLNRLVSEERGKVFLLGMLFLFSGVSVIFLEFVRGFSLGFVMLISYSFVLFGL